MKTAVIMRRSFIAMFWGWVACNAAILLVLFITELIQGGVGLMTLFYLLTLVWTVHVLFMTGLVVLAAWLLFFLPTDLLVKESSYLRTPACAGACGGLAGFMSVWLLFLFTEIDDSGGPLILSLLAAICGLTASLHLVRHHPRQEQAGVPASFSNNPSNDL